MRDGIIFLTYVRLNIEVGLVAVQAEVRHLDDVLELPGLLFHFGCQKEGGRGDGVPVELAEAVEHVEPLHVHDRGIDTQLGPETEEKKVSR